jgi:hypothetical protein
MRMRWARSLGLEALMMIDRVPELLVQDEDGASQRAKFSQLMLEFAEPLLAIARAEGPSIEALRRSMMLATLCWNAPLRAVQGDDRAQRELDVFLKSAEPALRAALRSMLSSRMTQYAGVPFAVFANVEGSSAENARCVAYATATPEELAALEGTRPAPIPLTPIGRFADAFPELAEREQKVWTVDAESADGLAPGSYLLEERYCLEQDCDCRRVQLWVHGLTVPRVIATIGYAFEPPPREYAHFEKQVELDPLHPQSDLSDAALARFEAEISSDRAYRARLIEHYEAWKAIVDDPTHPQHARLGVRRRRPHEPRAYPPRAQPARRAPKVKPNELCPCGSGRKYKRCCNAPARSQSPR